MEQSGKIERLTVQDLANELDKLQSKENDGRGVSVVRSIIVWLKAGKILEAQLEASLDHDKIRNYPQIEKFLKEQLFDGEELWRWKPKS